MKPRIRAIKNLYFRWGRAVGLEPEAVALVLEAHGFIELTSDRQHYRETDKPWRSPAYNDAIPELLLNFKRGLKDGNK